MRNKADDEKSMRKWKYKEK